MSLPSAFSRVSPWSRLRRLVTGVDLALYSADTAYDIELQRAPDDGSGNAPDTGSAFTLAVLPGNSTTFRDLVVLGNPVYYRIRHTLERETASDWTSWLRVVPGDLSSTLSSATRATSTLTGSFPAATGLSDLGSVDRKWKDLYLSGDAYIGDDLIVTDDASIGGDLSVAGTLSLTTLALSGSGSVGGDFSVGDDLLVTGDGAFGGSVSMGSLFTTDIELDGELHVDTGGYFRGNAANGYRFKNAANSVVLLQVTDGGDAELTGDFTANDFVLGAGGGTPGTAGAPLEILDEGVSLTVDATSIDFVGAGVTVTHVGNAVTVSVPVGAGGVSSVFGRSGAVVAAATDYAATDFTLNSGKKLYVDGGSDTYLMESSADVLDFYTGATHAFRITSTYVAPQFAVLVNSGQKVFLDGGGDTYLYESAANIAAMYVGGVVNWVATTSAFAIGGHFIVPAGSLLWLDGGGDTYLLEVAPNVIRVVAGTSSVADFSASFVSLQASINFAVAATQRIYVDGGSNTYLHEDIADRIAFVAGGATLLYASTAGVILPATVKLYLDGGGDTYIVEDVANRILMYAGGNASVQITSTFLTLGAGVDFAVQPTRKLYLDGGGDTYIYESVANRATLFVGGIGIAEWTASNAIVHGGLLLDATKRLYLDSGGDTYLYESSDNDINVVAGGTLKAAFRAFGVQIFNGDLSIQSLQKFYLDGGGDTYIDEVSANVLRLVAGGTGTVEVHSTYTRLYGSLGVGAVPVYAVDVQGTVGTVGVRVHSDTGNDIWYYSTGSVTGNAYIFYSGVSATDAVIGLLYNNSTAANARTSLQVMVNNASSGDPVIEFTVSGVNQWVMGLDNSDGDAFVWSWNTPLGGGNKLKLDSSGNLYVNATARLYLDGGGDTYLYESGANTVALFVGGVNALNVTTGGYSVKNMDLTVDATRRFYLDGGSNTYMYEESGGDVISVVTGGTSRFRFTNSYVEVINATFLIQSGAKLGLDGSASTDTYFIEATANQIDVYTGGSRRAYVNSSGITATDFILA